MISADGCPLCKPLWFTGSGPGCEGLGGLGHTPGPGSTGSFASFGLPLELTFSSTSPSAKGIMPMAPGGSEAAASLAIRSLTESRFVSWLISTGRSASARPSATTSSNSTESSLERREPWEPGGTARRATEPASCPSNAREAPEPHQASADSSCSRGKEEVLGTVACVSDCRRLLCDTAAKRREQGAASVSAHFSSTMATSPELAAFAASSSRASGTDSSVFSSCKAQYIPVSS